MILEITSTEYLIPVISGTILFALLVTFIIYFILLYRKTQYKLDWERERMKQELLRVENEVKEQTLINVSRELHDNFGQVASLIKINLNMISKDLKPGDLQKVSESLLLIRQLIGDIKALSASLSGEKIRKLGWLIALSEDVRRINAIGAMQIEFTEGEHISLPHEKEVILYRIIQELFNNSLKHAKASQAHLSIESNEGQVFVRYADNGIGFNEDQVVYGSGLTNINERCKMIEAKVELQSQKGEGTRISITLENYETVG